MLVSDVTASGFEHTCRERSNHGLSASARNEVIVSTNIAQFDIFEDFEEHIIGYLAAVSDLEVFGRSWTSSILPLRNVCRTGFGMPCKKISISLL